MEDNKTTADMFAQALREGKKKLIPLLLGLSLAFAVVVFLATFDHSRPPVVIKAVGWALASAMVFMLIMPLIMLLIVLVGNLLFLVMNQNDLLGKSRIR